MEQLTFRTEINASAAVVWKTLWDDATFRQWAGVIDPGTYMVGELIVGNEVQYISAENGYGVTSFVVAVEPGRLLVLKHSADTQNSGQQQRHDEWTGGQERYTLAEQACVTTLTAVIDVPVELVTLLSDSYPRAFAVIKELAEASQTGD